MSKGKSLLEGTCQVIKVPVIFKIIVVSIHSQQQNILLLPDKWSIISWNDGIYFRDLLAILVLRIEVNIIAQDCASETIYGTWKMKITHQGDEKGWGKSPNTVHG